MIEQTAEQKAAELAEKAAIKIAVNTDNTSKFLGGPRFLFVEYIEEIKQTILRELNLAELVKCKERCEALEYDNVEISKNAAQIRARLDEAMAENSILRRQNDMTGTSLEGVTKERDSLRAKVQELEKDKADWRTMAIELKRRLADLNAAHEAFYIDWSKFNHASLDYDEGYKPVFPDVSKDAESALKQFREMDIQKALRIDNAREGKPASALEHSPENRTTDP